MYNLDHGGLCWPQISDPGQGQRSEVTAVSGCVVGLSDFVLNKKKLSSFVVDNSHIDGKIDI